MPHRGNATLESLALAVLFALLLGALGITLDDIADAASTGSANYQPAQLEPGQAELLTAQARAKCAVERGDNSGVIFDAHGVIVCTDKHGRRGRHATATATAGVTP